MKKLLVSLMLFGTGGIVYGQVSTPGTGVHWNMDSLVVHFPAVVTQNGMDFSVSQPITFAEKDTFYLDDVINVLFDSAATMEFVKSVVLIDPDAPVNFTATDTAKGFARIRLDSVQTAVFNHLNLVYSSGISLISSRASFLNSRFQQTKHSGNDPSGALSLLKSDIVVDSSLFIENARSAITAGATAVSNLKILNSSFSYNDYDNGNYPQINIGSAGDSGVVIRNCIIEGKYTRAGAIGFLNITNADYTIRIENNSIKNNRYGVAVTGRGISGFILHNTIDSNNIEGEPMLGGSGLNFQGDSSIRIIAAGNSIRNNLWGVTVQAVASSAPLISLGRAAPSNPVDTGGNIFQGNGNNDTLYAVFNNTPDTVWAQNNYWDFSTADSIESTISHHPDDSALGWVIYEPFRIGPPVHIEAVNPEAAFAKVYPNPVSTAAVVLYIHAERDIESVCLYDIQGRKVYSSEGVQKPDLSIDMSTLQAGIYFLQIRSKQQIQNQKIILR